MPRYIDADKLNIKKATMWFDDPNDRRSVERMIREAPTADVVDVVRCRECKHRGTDYCIFHIKGEPADEELLLKLDNDFCSYGERKDCDD